MVVIATCLQELHQLVALYVTMLMPIVTLYVTSDASAVVHEKGLNFKLSKSVHIFAVGSCHNTLF